MNEFIARHNSDGDGMLDEMYDYWVKDFDAETSKTEQGGFSGENGELIIACEGGRRLCRHPRCACAGNR